jgi:hypothetical protein
MYLRRNQFTNISTIVFLCFLNSCADDSSSRVQMKNAITMSEKSFSTCNLNLKYASICDAKFDLIRCEPLTVEVEILEVFKGEGCNNELILKDNGGYFENYCFQNNTTIFRYQCGDEFGCYLNLISKEKYDNCFEL